MVSATAMVRIAVGTNPVGGVMVNPNQPNSPMVETTENVMIVRVNNIPEKVRNKMIIVMIVCETDCLVCETDSLVCETDYLVFVRASCATMMLM